MCQTDWTPFCNKPGSTTKELYTFVLLFTINDMEKKTMNGVIKIESLNSKQFYKIMLMTMTKFILCQ